MPNGSQPVLVRVTILLLGVLLALQVQTLEAKQSIPQCIRVYKNGVIYYYFSNRSVDASPNYAAAKVRLRGPRSRTQPQRLSRPELERLIKEASHQNKLPPSLIKAVIRVESNFNPGATSPKGAMGMMQLMPGTASDLQVGDPYDSRENILAGSRYLRMLLDKFNFHLPLALAAYNAGPERVKKHQQVPPIRETQAFVRNVCVNFLKYDEDKPK
ncbi:MAG: lytic transglycosylase domain-containing protein [Desulfobacca sp.]|nr:lytic transglycosylase domain-containing protein [Desulfobacca sp.]